MIHLISPEVMHGKNFSWIKEISTTPYYSVIYPLNLFMAKDKAINETPVLMGYIYSARVFRSGVLLAKILQETNILPKNFSVLPMIEKSLRSGSKEYCGTIKYVEHLQVVEKLHGKKFKASKLFVEKCLVKMPKGVRDKEIYDMRDINKVRKVKL